MTGKRSVDDLPMSGRLSRLILALPFECLSVDKVVDILIAYSEISFVQSHKQDEVRPYGHHAAVPATDIESCLEEGRDLVSGIRA